jgi:hypothetical protein
MKTKLLKEYNIELDKKKRITIRGNTGFKNYHVCIFNDGKVVMEPRVLVKPFEISEATLRMMDSAMENFAKGIVSEPVDVNEMMRLADELPD